MFHYKEKKNDGYERDETYCWGWLVRRESTGWLSQHSTVDTRKKTEPYKKSQVWWSVRGEGGGEMVDEGRIPIIKLGAPRLVAGGAGPRLLQ
jgi:hypothetical protein